MRLVPVKMLKKNSYLAIDVLDSKGRLMLSADEKVDNKVILKLQRLELDYVYIRDRYCYEDEAERLRTISNIRPFFLIIQYLRDIAKRMFNGDSKATDLKNIREISEAIVKYTIRLPENSKIMFEPTKLFAHSVVEETIYVTIMSVHLGHKMGFSIFRLISLCQAALMRNFALLSPKFESVIDPLNRGDKTHPLLAYKYLLDFNVSNDILEGILHHHERHDGRGFPQNLKGDQIHPFAQIISIIDAFYEIRSEHDPVFHDEDTFEESFYRYLRRFNPNVVDVFLKNVQLLNVDTMVELNNGCIGVVIKNNSNLPFKPRVQIIEGYKKMKTPVVDLAIDNYYIKRIVYYLR